MRKLESFFYKIDTCLQKTITCIGLWAEQIFSVNAQYTYFSILGTAFSVLALCYFQKLQLLVVKKFSTNFWSIVLLYLWAQKVCLTLFLAKTALKTLMGMCLKQQKICDIFSFFEFKERTCSFFLKDIFLFHGVNVNQLPELTRATRDQKRF